MKNVPLPQRLVKSFPFLPSHMKAEVSVWDSFKTVMNSGSRFWWTQQWLMGYVTWAVFVGIESE